MRDNMQSYDGVSLFSGGLDSILAVKVLESQGLKIKSLHFTSPFFGDSGKLPYWRETYGLDLEAADITVELVDLLRAGPPHGVGSVLNPCVDCKIAMLKRAKELMPRYGAKFLVSGEVLGQRPMSQRRDSLHVILRDAGVKGALLRPLCAKLLDPTEAELSGLVDRERLLAFSGRGRKAQLALAAEYGVMDIPTPAGGCLLTERENARSFWPLLALMREGRGVRPEDFFLARVGRQFWNFSEGRECLGRWLLVGRDNDDNQVLHGYARDGDLTFKVRDYPGPVALARRFSPWDESMILDAASMTASFSGKAVKSGCPVDVRVHEGGKGLDGPGRVVEVTPARKTAAGWAEYSWEQAKAEIKASDIFSRTVMGKEI